MSFNKAIQARRASEAAQSQPDALARDSTGNHASNAMFRSTPFVPQGRATRDPKYSQQGPRPLATLSLANASGCDGGTLRSLPFLSFLLLLLSASFAHAQPQRPFSLPSNGNLLPAGQQQYQYQSYSPQLPPSPQSAAPNPLQTVPPDARLAANVNGAAGPTSSAEMSSGTNEKSSVRSLLQMFRDGGLMMYPIAACSFALMVFTFERFISLRSGRVIPRPFVKRLIEQLQQQQIDRDEAIELCEQNPSPIANVLIAGVKRYGRSAVEVEQAILDAGERESNNLRRHMRLLNAISQVAPLLGLLGTVFGMIQSFNNIASSQAMGRPELLAGGIGEALITTAAGLLVAIPAYLLYMYFLGHTDRLVMEIDQHSQRLVEVISAEGLQESDSSRSRSRSRKAA